MNTKLSHSNRQSGAVSLFVVIFAALLMTVVTVSFVQLMVKDQEQATASDLSQNAYDSAQAGVEDAKRLLLALAACKDSPKPECDRYAEAVSDGECSTIAQANIGTGGTAEETIIQQGEDDKELDQAYTCVKIDLDTEDYARPLLKDKSLMIPLRATAAFDTVTIRWFTNTNAGGNAVALKDTAGELPPLGDDWPSNMPALLRAQLIQTGNSFQLADFDDTADDEKSNANTLFLYPALIGGTEGSFSSNARRAPTTEPLPVKCEPSFNSSVVYACKMTLKLPNAKNGGDAERGAYLRLTSLYNDSDIQVQLYDSKTNQDVKFQGVQPVVDSTGRANDLFRRIKARVELSGTFPYPEAAIDMTGNLCKNFLITDKPGDYVSSCTP